MKAELRLEMQVKARPPEIILDEVEHQYYVDGVPKRSWSSIARAANLLDDLSGVPVHILENAKARGSQVDDACSLIMEGQYSEELIYCMLTTEEARKGWEEARPYVEAYREWWNREPDANYPPISVQTPLYCAKLDFCCTPDWYNPLSVNDIKATAKPSRSWGLQTAAQQLAHGSAMVRRIIHLTPKLKARQYSVYTDHEGNTRIFSPLDYQVVEAACQGDYDADCIKRWRAGE